MIAIFENFCEKFGLRRKKFGWESKFRKNLYRIKMIAEVCGVQ
jgi:hypothetical protein